jgi:hypothetical protein
MREGKRSVTTNFFFFYFVGWEVGFDKGLFWLLNQARGRGNYYSYCPEIHISDFLPF